MRAITEGLVLRGAAAAQGYAEPRGDAIDAQLATKRIGSCLAHRSEVDGWSGLVRRSIEPSIADRSGGAGVGDLGQAFDRHRVRMDPGSLDVGEKHLRRQGDTE